MQKGLVNFFEKFLEKEPLFKDKEILQASYMPDNIVHRDEQIKQIAEILAPCLRLELPSNLFVYGQTGTGKTLITKYITNQLTQVSKSKGIDYGLLYVNCKLKRVADTEYRIIAHLARDLGKAIPPTGLPTDEVYEIFFTTLEKEKRLFTIVLDEIDQLVEKAGDGILYNLLRINSELKNSRVSIIGVSNNLQFINILDPRVRSSLSEEEVIFPPYNALQIKDILLKRAKKAFKQGVIAEGVIEKCAAYAAKEHGDARRALELLRVTGELAERDCVKKVTIKYVDKAEEKIEKDRFLDLIKIQPKQYQCVLYAVFLVSLKRKEAIFTGEVYEVYKRLCSQAGLRPLTQRRISDIIGDLDMMGLINTKIISKGRYGRTREISLTVPKSTEENIKKMLEDGLGVF